MDTWEGGTHDQKSLELPADLPSDAGGEDENSKGRCPSRQKGEAAALNRPFLVPGGVGGSTPELRSGDPGPSPGRGTKLLKVMGPPLLAQRRTRITNPGIGP